MPQQDHQSCEVLPQYQRRIIKTHIASRITGLSCRMICHLAQTGVLSGVRTGKRSWGFLLSDLENLQEARRLAQELGVRVNYKLNSDRERILRRDFPAALLQEKVKGALSAPLGEP